VAVARKVRALAAGLDAVDRVRVVVGADRPLPLSRESVDLVVLDATAETALETVMSGIRAAAPGARIVVCRPRRTPPVIDPVAAAHAPAIVAGSVVAVVAGMLVWWRHQADTSSSRANGASTARFANGERLYSAEPRGNPWPADGPNQGSSTEP